MDSDDYLLSPSQEDEIFRDLKQENVLFPEYTELNLSEEMIELHPYVNNVTNVLENENMSVAMSAGRNPSTEDYPNTLPTVPAYPVTGINPSTEDYPGVLNFSLELPGLSAPAAGKTHWIYSAKLNKVFINILKKLPIRLQWNQKPQYAQLYMRAMLVFTNAQDFQDPVERCRHHATIVDKSNSSINISEHVVHAEHKDAIYYLDAVSQRRSVVIPLTRPQPGDDTVTATYSFHCKNSCLSGMNRRPTQLIFTLETEMGVVVGRQTINIRICSSPKRDVSKEEASCNIGGRSYKRPMKPLKTLSKKTKFDNTIQMIELPVISTRPLRLALHLLLGDLVETARLEQRELNDQEQQLQNRYQSMLNDFQ